MQWNYRLKDKRKQNRKRKGQRSTKFDSLYQTSHLRKNEDKACSKNRRGRSPTSPLGNSKGFFRAMEEAGKKGKEGFPSSVL